MVYWTWTRKILELPYWTRIDFMIYWTCTYENTWTNLLDSDRFYYNQAGLLLEKSENVLELSVKQLVIQSSSVSSISLGPAMFCV